MKTLFLAISLLLFGCSESYQTPDYVGICNRVGHQMGAKDEQLCSPPTVFVLNAQVLGAMFPDLQAQHQEIWGVYSRGIVYLSQQDISNKVVAHEYAHYFGADEAKAKTIEQFYP